MMVASCCLLLQHLHLDLYNLTQELDNLPPRVSLITSSLDYLRKTRKVSVHRSKKEVSAQSSNLGDAKHLIPKLITNREHILQSYPDVCEGIGHVQGPPYHIQIDQSVTLKQKPCRPILVHLKEAFQQEIEKMLKVRVLKPVHEATPWINSFVLVDGKGKLGNLKLRICLDPTSLNKVIVRGPYHFKTLEDIVHLLADTCIMSVCDCKKGSWHQELDEASSCLITFNTELWRFRYNVMPFGATVAGDFLVQARPVLWAPPGEYDCNC